MRNKNREAAKTKAKKIIERAKSGRENTSQAVSQSLIAPPARAQKGDQMTYAEYHKLTKKEIAQIVAGALYRGGESVMPYVEGIRKNQVDHLAKNKKDALLDLYKIALPIYAKHGYDEGAMESLLREAKKIGAQEQAEIDGEERTEFPDSYTMARVVIGAQEKLGYAAEYKGERVDEIQALIKNQSKGGLEVAYLDALDEFKENYGMDENAVLRTVKEPTPQEVVRSEPQDIDEEPKDPAADGEAAARIDAKEAEDDASEHIPNARVTRLTAKPDDDKHYRDELLISKGGHMTLESYGPGKYSGETQRLDVLADVREQDALAIAILIWGKTGEDTNTREPYARVTTGNIKIVVEKGALYVWVAKVLDDIKNTTPENCSYYELRNAAEIQSVMTALNKIASYQEISQNVSAHLVY